MYSPNTLNASNYIKIHYSKESIFSNYFEMLVSLHVDLLNYLFEKQIFSGVREQITVSVAACRICGEGRGQCRGDLPGDGVKKTVKRKYCLDS